MSTILWAISSKCKYNCKYCYLSFPDDINPINNEKTKYLKDLSLSDICLFISSFPMNGITRVFLAGAEPLSYPEKIFLIINELKKYNVEVILCTSGYELENYCPKILESGVDAVSISLDSWDKKYNDKFRKYPKENGFEKVVSGILSLINEKNQRNSKIKIGVYTVLTSENLFDLEKTFQFVSDMGADYFIFQPIFLTPKHELYNKLVLKKEHAVILQSIINNLEKQNRKTKLPDESYENLLIRLIQGDNVIIENCFAGDDLFFITPEGHIHACPAGIMIQKETNPISIKNCNDVFVNKLLKRKTCDCFSMDCINMFQLINFDRLLE